MSGVVKSIGKVFKKVASSAGKILPLALGAAAVLYTAGWALGVTGTAGGWGAAASKIGSVFGEGSTLGKIVGGAITQAGYGAVTGAVTSAVTGGNPWKGAQMGALGGAVTGGVMGGLGMETDPLSVFKDSTPVAQDPQLTADDGTLSGAPRPPDLPDWKRATLPTEPGASSAPPGASKGLLDKVSGAFDKGGWVERNQQLVGGLVGGVGKGLLSNSGTDRYEVLAKAQKEQADRIAANYRTGSGWTAPPVGAMTRTGPGVMAPTAPATGQLVWDASTQKLVFVPAVAVG